MDARLWRCLRPLACLVLGFCIPLPAGYPSVGAARHSRKSTPSNTEFTNRFPPLPKFSEPVGSVSETLKAYTFVAEHPELSHYIPCFCTCWKKHDHHSIEDCYIKHRGSSPSSITWNSHAGECYICLMVASEARRLYLKGADIRTIRATIERTLAPKFRNHTDTPEPPTTTQR